MHSFLYSPTLTSIHDHWKNHSLTRWTFVGKVMSVLFNMLFRLGITFLPRRKHLLISWLQSPSAVILEPNKNKVSHCFHHHRIMHLNSSIVFIETQLYLFEFKLKLWTFLLLYQEWEQRLGEKSIQESQRPKPLLQEA